MPVQPVFLFVGQLERHKGVLDLLDAWSSWRDRGIATLRIAGDGALAAEVRRRADASITVLGRLDAAALAEELRRASYTVVPSRVIENAPTVIMESFAAGTPVIASGVGGIPELVREGETGFMFPERDTEAIAAVLVRAASVPAISWERMSRSCREALSGDHAGELTAVYNLIPFRRA